jgi:hypothetical protein
MEFARVKVTLVRVKRPQVMTAPPVKMTPASAPKAMQRERALKASQPVERLRVLENHPARAKQARPALALAAQQLDRPAQVFASPNRQLSVPSRD